MDDPDIWRWIWLATAAFGVVGEILTAGMFFLLPFGVGAAAACVLAFAGTGIAVQWLAFVGVTAVGFVATRSLARRMDASTPSEGIGAQRWIGQVADVLSEIAAGPGGSGLVRVGREEWRAQSIDGSPLEVGALVRVVEMRGTQLVVRRVDPEEVV